MELLPLSLRSGRVQVLTTIVAPLTGRITQQSFHCFRDRFVSRFQGQVRDKWA